MGAMQKRELSPAQESVPPVALLCLARVSRPMARPTASVTSCENDRAVVIGAGNTVTRQLLCIADGEPCGEPEAWAHSVKPVVCRPSSCETHSPVAPPLTVSTVASWEMFSRLTRSTARCVRAAEELQKSAPAWGDPEAQGAEHRVVLLVLHHGMP